jgi:hypothetical protein
VWEFAVCTDHPARRPGDAATACHAPSGLSAQLLRGTKVTVLATVAILLVAAACSSESDEDPTADASSTTETTADGGATATSETTEPGGGEDEESGQDEEAEADPLGTATGRLPASPNDSALVPLRLDVTGLDRLDGMVELRVTITNEGRRSTPDFEPYSSFDDPRLPTGQGQYSLSGASLVDAEGERAYLTIVDSEGTCLCTGRLAQVAVAAGDSFEMYADFGGLPGDLDQVDVQVPGFPTVDSVPIG